MVVEPAPEPKDVVRRGYDAVSYHYRADDAEDGRYRPWIAGLLHRIAGWLRPGGWLPATAGHDAWTGTEDDWLGAGAPMWWSHADAAGYRSWLGRAGLQVTTESFVPEGAGGHTLFWARRPA